jgi:Thioredoxin domain-containing protein 17-like, thioredoxin domain
MSAATEAKAAEPKFTSVLLTEPEKFDDVLEANKPKADGHLFVLITGANDEKTGKSWCPDCTAAKVL